MTVWAVWILFFLSGACGLIYEVLWSKQLGLILGNTVYSLSAVLAAFMGGLALGSFLAGRWIGRSTRLLYLYGLIEIGIGLYCLALPWLFDVCSNLYVALYAESDLGLNLSRFIISFILLVIPTTGMGATLPLLSQYLARSPENVARTVGSLYAINTFGAVLGAVLAGFVLLPQLGKQVTNWVAVSGNVILGLTALLWSYRSEIASERTGTSDDAAPTQCATPVIEPIPVQPYTTPELWDRRTILAALTLFITGFAAMSTQIGWTRALALALGSSTYAFSLIVAVFILGLALGGSWAARMVEHWPHPVLQLRAILLLIGCCALALVSLLGYAPLFFFWLIAYGSQWGFHTLLFAEALGVALLLFPPTFLMGTLLPLIVQLVRQQAATLGVARMIGNLYAINTVGSILGSLCGGLLLLPLLQIEVTLKVSAFLYALPAVLLFFLADDGSVTAKVIRENSSMARSDRSSRRLQRAAYALLALLLPLTLLPGWDPFQMSSGAYLMRESASLQAARDGRLLEAIPATMLNENRKLLFYREGISATVAVIESPAGLTLTIGGKPDASSYGDMSTQLGLTLIPALVSSQEVKSMLTIGMGSGVSLGAALQLPALEKIELIEISPEVLAASAYFANYSGLRYKSTRGRMVLDEDRIAVRINDGRNHLKLTSEHYDVIASEPSNPWIAGIGNLFTYESFQLCRSRLKPGGVMCQWVHRYGLGEREFKSVLRTFGAVFPYMQLWCVLPGQDYLLLGSDAPLILDVSRLHQRLMHPGIQKMLQPVGLESVEQLLACLLDDRESLLAWSDSAPLHTDDNMLMEFAAPKTLYAGSNQFAIAPLRRPLQPLLELSGLSHEKRQPWLARLDLTLLARLRIEQYRDHTSANPELLSAASVLMPEGFTQLQSTGTPTLRQQSSEPSPLYREAQQMLQAGAAGKAEALLKEALQHENLLDEERLALWELYGDVTLSLGRTEAAQSIYRQAAAQAGRHQAAAFKLRAKALLTLKQPDARAEAIALLTQAVQQEPLHAGMHLQLATAYVLPGTQPTLTELLWARLYAQGALALNPQVRQSQLWIDKCNTALQLKGWQ